MREKRSPRRALNRDRCALLEGRRPRPAGALPRQPIADGPPTAAAPNGPASCPPCWLNRRSTNRRSRSRTTRPRCSDNHLGGQGIEAVSALAGTGKTTTISALARAYEGAGWRVIGATPTARAARQLRDIAAVGRRRMHSFIARIDRGNGLDARTVLVIDEAGMAPTRLTGRLLAHAEQAGAKVIAVGDPGRLGSVQAGGWLAALTRLEAGPALREVMRQRDPAEQQSLQALHDGDPDPYLEHQHDESSSTTARSTPSPR